MKKVYAALLVIAVLAFAFIVSAEACTSFLLRAKDGSTVYGRTCEWGAFDMKSGLVMVPRNMEFVSELGGGKTGMAWKNKLGFVAVNGLNKPLYLDGMNEKGLTIGCLYLPGFAEYQSIKAGEESSSLNTADVIIFILGQFETVEQVKAELAKLRVISNPDNEKAFGTPIVVHWVVTDSTGSSIVIEYVEGKLSIHDNTIGVMTNSPPYDWQVANLRNYFNLTPLAQGPGDSELEGVNFTPFSSGAGMKGLPGDYSSPSRFVRAFFYTGTSLPSELEDVDAAIRQASRILDNFDIPKGIVREGSPDKFLTESTQWTIIGDIKNRRYHWWTEWNRQMRMVDLGELSFEGTELVSIPLDEIKAQNIDNRTKELG